MMHSTNINTGPVGSGSSVPLGSGVDKWSDDGGIAAVTSVSAFSASPPKRLDVNLEGQVAYVTGGVGGIGRACVDTLLAHGAQVALTFAQNNEREAVEAKNLEAAYPRALSTHPLELRSMVSIRQGLADAQTRWGNLHILVNSAAVGSATVAAFAGDAAGQDTAMFLINADGALKVAQAFVEMARSQRCEQPRKIINFSSVGGGVQAFPGFRLSDGMSKAAVAFMTRQLAAETVDTNIDVFAVCPGATNTRMFQMSTLDPMSPEERVRFTRSLPKGRLIEPEEIAHIVLFLASDYSTPMHGAVIDASMGLGVRPGLISERTL